MHGPSVNNNLSPLWILANNRASNCHGDIVLPARSDLMLHEIVIHKVARGSLINPGPIFNLTATGCVSKRHFAFLKPFETFQLALNKLHRAQSFIKHLLRSALAPLLVAVAGMDIYAFQLDLFRILKCL